MPSLPRVLVLSLTMIQHLFRQETHMSIKTLLAALVLVAAPGLAMAECSWGAHEVTMSCAEGTAWDGDSQSCIPVVSS